MLTEFNCNQFSFYLFANFIYLVFAFKIIFDKVPIFIDNKPVNGSYLLYFFVFTTIFQKQNILHDDLMQFSWSAFPRLPYFNIFND